MSKVLFFDVDGTLVQNDKGVDKIPPAVIEKLNEIKEKGNHLFIATGRPYAFVNEYLTSLNFDGFVMANGSHVMVEGKSIFENYLGQRNVAEVVSYLDSHQVEYILQDNKYGYLKAQFTNLWEFYQRCNIKEDHIISEFDEAVYHKIIKMEISLPANLADEFIAMIDGKFNYDYNGTINAFEVYSKDITKAQGIEKTLAYYNLEISDSFAFGDGHNDIEMIKAVGCGVVMGNGVDELKQIADYVTDDFMDDGLLKALNKFF